jgi:hypothetical protein
MTAVHVTLEPAPGNLGMYWYRTASFRAFGTFTPPSAKYTINTTMENLGSELMDLSKSLEEQQKSLPTHVGREIYSATPQIVTFQEKPGDGSNLQRYASEELIGTDVNVNGATPSRLPDIDAGGEQENTPISIDSPHNRLRRKSSSAKLEADSPHLKRQYSSTTVFPEAP